jgi:vitamin K-dependent gamma-carboxylase
MANLSRPTRSPTATAALQQPVDAASLAAFRIALGLILVWEIGRYFAFGWIGELFLRPAFLFKYPGLEWLAPLPGAWLYVHFLVLGVLAALIAVGYQYRLATALFWLGFTYVALLDRTQYLNHFYLISLLVLLLCFVPANSLWSLDARLRPQLRSDTVPAWSLWLLRFQVAIPYLYGGIAKLNGDWLHGLPMQIWMSRMTGVQRVVPAFGEHWLALVFSYGGLAFDLAIVPLLLWQRTRYVAFAAAAAFHVMNAVMFQIGIFPWLMIAATTLFLPPDWPRWLLGRLRGQTTNLTNQTNEAGNRSSPIRTIRTIRGFSFLTTFVAVFVILQLVVPLRHWIYPGNVDWTEEGTLFSWRMMLNDKPAAVRFTAVDPATGQESPIDPRNYLIPHQIERMSRDPELLRQFATALQADQRAHGKRAEIRVLAIVSLNGRKPQLLIDPQIDLGAQPASWWVQPWIVPLTEPLRWPPWPDPPSAWEQVVSPIQHGT